MISHQGHSIKSGHYVFVDVQEHLTIDNQNIIPLQKIDTKDPYLLIYKKFS